MTPQEILDRSQLAASTRSTYRQSLDEWLRFAPEVEDWCPMAVEAWRDYQLGQGLSASTVNRNLSAVRFLGRRVSALGLGKNFARGAESARGEVGATQRLALTIGEAQRMMDTCDTTPRGVRDRAILQLGLRCAMRVGEICRLEWSGVRKPTVTYRAKGGRMHTSVCDDLSWAALSRWRKASSRAEGRELSDAVFRSIYYQLSDNRPRLRPGINRKSVWSMVRARGDLARIGRPVYPHLLRHTFVVWAIEAGRPLNEIMAQTGHRSIDSLSRYVSNPRAVEDPIGNYLPSVE